MTTSTPSLQRLELKRTEPAAPAVRRRRHFRPRESTVVFAVFLAVYVATAAFLLRHNVIFADALSRVGNAYYVLYSRDRHLPAVGFVWNPLPSLVLLPVLPLKALFPALVHYGLAGNLESATCMAGAVAVLGSCLAKLNVPRIPRLVLTALFGLQPMIMLYGGAGLSEAMLLLFCLLATNALIGWTQERKPGSLVTAGLTLGLGYMTRYEAVAPAIGAMALVGALTAFSSPGRMRYRLQLAANDMALVGGPFVFAFAVWAIMSRLLVKQWFPTFSSTYGNAAQVSSGRSSIQSVTGSTTPQILHYLERQAAGLSPWLTVIAIAAVVAMVRLRRWADIVGPVLLGGVLTFDDMTTLTGSSFGWLRFQITLVPLTVLLAGTVVAGSVKVRIHSRATPPKAPMIAATPRLIEQAWVRRATYIIAATVVSALVAEGLPAQAHLLTTTRGGLAREESPILRSTFFPSRASKEERKSTKIFDTERQIARYLDNLHNGPGFVLTDTAYAYSIVLASNSPSQFLITSDRDFNGAVADPTGHHVRYMLVPSPNLGPADALQRKWPRLYQSGDRIGVFVKQWTGQFFGNWRLYRVR